MHYDVLRGSTRCYEVLQSTTTCVPQCIPCTAYCILQIIISFLLLQVTGRVLLRSACVEDGPGAGAGSDQQHSPTAPFFASGSAYPGRRAADDKGAASSAPAARAVLRRARAPSK